MITTAPELIYMLKVNIGIALFYAFYKLFCCRDTFFQWRRIALLSFLALPELHYGDNAHRYFPTAKSNPVSAVVAPLQKRQLTSVMTDSLKNSYS